MASKINKKTMILFGRFLQEAVVSMPRFLLINQRKKIELLLLLAASAMSLYVMVLVFLLEPANDEMTVNEEISTINRSVIDGIKEWREAQKELSSEEYVVNVVNFYDGNAE